MGQLTTSDRQFLSRLREAGVIEEVVPNSMYLSDGVIAVLCSDGDQFFDCFGHIARVCRGAISRERVHPLSLNGGALALSKTWPDREKGAVLERDIDAAVDMKNIHTIVLYGHAPCGAAGKYCFSVAETMAQLMQAKVRVKGIRSDIKVICFFHVDWDSARKRTYFLSRDKWIAWVARTQSEGGA